MTAPELKLCPFCKSANVGRWKPGSCVVCHNCGAEGPMLSEREFETDEEAWNTRADLADAAVAAAIEMAAAAPGWWLGLNSQFEPDGTYCIVKPSNDPRAQYYVSAEAIRALATDAQTDALEAVRREARMEGFRAGFEQATICDFDDWLDAWAISKLNTAQEDDADNAICNERSDGPFVNVTISELGREDGQ